MEESRERTQQGEEKVGKKGTENVTEKKKNWKTRKNIAASSDGGPKLSVQPPPRWHQEKGAQRAHAFTVTLWQSGFN